MLQHQLATGVEAVYGTAGTLNRFYELLGGESLGRSNIILPSAGLKPGTRARLGSRRVQTGRSGSGSVSFEVATTGFGRFFEHMLGADPVIVQQEATAAHLHTYLPGDLRGKSFTLQKGVERQDGVAEPFTFVGCKIPSWEMTISRNGLLILNLDIDSQDVVTNIALATADYPAISLFHFMQATLRRDGVPVANVSEYSARGTTPMDVERYFFGTAGLKDEPLENDHRTIEGTLTAEFVDLATFYAAFEADTSLELELSFVGDKIAEGASVDYFAELAILFDDVRLTGETPKVQGPQPAVQNIPFEAYETDTNDLMAITYQTTDVGA